MKQVRAIISSKLQGSGLKAFVVERASSNQLRGYIQNCRKCTEIVVEGEDQAVDDFLNWVQSEQQSILIQSPEEKFIINYEFNSFEARLDSNSLFVRKYCEFGNENGTRFFAETGEDFMEIFINFDNDDWLFPRLKTGYFEAWLRHIGELELSNLILDVNNNNRIKNKVKAIKNKFKSIKYFQTIDLEKIIEIKLKEYETLRAEILFHIQNRTQIILLGLTGIFAIATLALTPLTDFFTAEKITIPINKIVATRKIDDTGEEITIPLPINNNIVLTRKIDGRSEKITIQKKSKLVATKAIDGKTINNKAIIPTVVILVVIIPIASLYIIIRLSVSTKTILEINKYIKNIIEGEISQLLKIKLENEIYYSKKIEKKDTFLNIYQNRHLTESDKQSWQKYMKGKRRNFQLTETNFLYWERYIDRNRDKLRDRRIINIVKFLFGLLAILSWLGSCLLLSWDFTCSNSECSVLSLKTTEVAIWVAWSLWTVILLVIVFHLKEDLLDSEIIEE